MPVQTRGNGWRARRKKGGKTYTGPIRETEAAANEDAQRLDEAAEVSIERLQEVHARLTRVLPVASVAQLACVYDRRQGESSRSDQAIKSSGARRSWPTAGL